MTYIEELKIMIDKYERGIYTGADLILRVEGWVTRTNNSLFKMLETYNRKED